MENSKIQCIIFIIFSIIIIYAISFHEPFQATAEWKKANPNLLKGYYQTFPEDYIPIDKEAEEWAKINPNGKGSLINKNLLDSGRHLGVNTQGVLFKNSNQQLRNEPANPVIPTEISHNKLTPAHIFHKSFNLKN